MKIYTLLFVSVLMTGISFAQGEFLVEIDRSNDSFSKIGPAIANVGWIYTNERTFREDLGEYLFTSSQPDFRLFSINSSNGIVENSPLLLGPKFLSLFEFDQTSENLYCIEQDSQLNEKNLVLLDVMTGVVSSLGGVSIQGSGIYQGFSSFDQTNQRFIFVAPSNSGDLLYSIDVTNGTILFNPLLNISSGETLINIDFHSATGILYGLLEDHNDDLFYLVTIDTQTGAIVKLGNGTTLANDSGCSSTIDEQNQEYIILYESPSIGGYAVTTFSLSSGNPISNSLILPYINNDNLFGIEYDNVQQRLFSLHWETTTSSVSVNSLANSANITSYPNPFSSTISFTFDSEGHPPYNLVIYDITGRVVSAFEEIEGTHFKTPNLMLSSGVYEYILSSDEKMISKGKIHCSH